MDPTNPSIRIGVIGAGEHMTRGHLEHLVLDPRVKVAAWHDPQRGKAVGAALLERAGATWLSEDELFSSPEVDMVFVGSPDKCHIPHLAACIAAGKHVMCEKPIGVNMLDMADLLRSIEDSQKAGLLLSTCHPRRFDPPILDLKRMIENPDEGDHPLRRIVGTVERFEFGFWYHKPSKKGLHVSLMSDHFSHEIDLFRFLFGGEPHAFSGRVTYDGELSYRASGTASGARQLSFEFCGHRHLEEEIYVETVRLIGTRGSASLNLNTGLLTEERTGQTIPLRPKSYEVMFGDLNRNLVDAALGEAPLYIDTGSILFNNESTAALVFAGSFNFCT